MSKLEQFNSTDAFGTSVLILVKDHENGASLCRFVRPSMLGVGVVPASVRPSRNVPIIEKIHRYGE